MPTKPEERRLLTILFADLSGFTSLSSGLDPEDVREIANICIEYMNTQISKHGGSIHKYEGDSVIALFGLPAAHEDDQERAVKASLDIMKNVSDLNKTLSLKLKTKTKIGLHIGIHSGTVVAGELGSHEKIEYTVMGDVVNLASRIKDAAKRGEILVSEQVFRASRYLFDYEILPATKLKGIEKEVRVFKPLKKKDKPGSKRGISGIYSPLVGRKKELNRLKYRAKNLHKGNGGAVFVLGGAGLGKTRLYEEFKKTLVKQPEVNQPQIIILESRCLSYGETLPYWPFTRILGSVFNIDDNDSTKQVKEKLLKISQNIFPDDWQNFIPYIGDVFSISFGKDFDEKIKHLDAEGLKVQVFVNIRKLLNALSIKQHLLLVIEDYHWIDAASLELLQFIFDCPKPPSVLLLCLSRIVKEKECYKTMLWLKNRLKSDFEEIILPPLDKETSNQLIYNLLKIPSIPDNFKENILAKSEGNPFYLEEILRSLIDSDLLLFSKGTWHLKFQKSDAAGLEPTLKTNQEILLSIPIPDTVQAVISSRLDKLEPDVKNILQMASVIGRSFNARILESLSGIDSLMLSLHLATLEEYEYISEYKKEPELKYIFKHPLLHEVTYASLLKRKRAQLHLKTAQLIEKIYKNRLNELTDILAHQYLNSNDHKNAVKWLRRAGERAMKSYANEEAINYFLQALSKLTEDPKNAEVVSELAIHEACRILGNLYKLKGDNKEALKSYEKMYISTDDKLVQSWAKLKSATVYELQGKYDEALKVINFAEEICARPELVNVDTFLKKSQIHIARSWVFRLKGETEKAIQEIQKGLKILDTLKSEKMKLTKDDDIKIKEIRANGLNISGIILWFKGEYNEAIDFYKKYLTISQELGNKAGIGRATNNLGVIYQFQGDHDKAIKHFQEFLKISEEIGDKQGIGGAYGNLGAAYHRIQKYDTAMELHQKHLKISEEVGYKRGVVLASSNLGVIFHYKGEYEQALQIFQKSLKIAKNIGDKQEIGRINGQIGMIYSDIGQYDKGIEHLQCYLENAKAIGDKQGIGRASANLGLTFLMMEKLDKAEEYLANAETQLKMIDNKQILIYVWIYQANLQIKRIKDKESQAGIRKALVLADKAFKLAEMIGSKVDKANCHFLYAKIYSAVQDFSKAEDNFSKAIEICTGVKKKLLADLCLEYARMLRSSGNEALCKIYLGKAIKVFKEIKLEHKIKECENISKNKV